MFTDTDFSTIFDSLPHAIVDCLFEETISVLHLKAYGRHCVAIATLGTKRLKNIVDSFATFEVDHHIAN